MAKQRRQPISFEQEQEPQPQPEPEPQPEPQPAEAAVTTQQPESPPPASASPTPFQEMLFKEYHAALDKQIRAASNKVMERFTRLMSQERTPTDDSPKDALGNRSDFYENLVTAVQTGDPRVGKTKEEVYEYLAKLNFTGMRDLAAIKQEYQQV